MNKRNKLSKSAAILLMLFITFVMIYFTVYESEYINHNCNHADCSICHVLHVAQSITKNICSGNLAIYAGFFYLVGTIILVPYVLHSHILRNLIIDKVRLNH